MENTVINEKTVCECDHVHLSDVCTTKRHMPKEEDITQLGEFFKVFGEASRLKILYFLYGRQLSVGEIAEGVGSTVSAVSHQLKILKNARLVKFRKEGKSCIYSLDDDHISDILAEGMQHISE